MKTFLTLMLFLATSVAAHADSGTLLQRWETSGVAVFVFAAPTPLRAGPAEFEILVQDLQTGVPRLDGSVRLIFENAEASSSAEAWVPPCCRQHVPNGTRWEVSAAPSTHGNRLCFTAPTIFPAAGKYRVTVQTNGAAGGTAEIVVEPALPPVVEYWPLIGLPFLLTGLFFVNRMAARRQGRD